MQLLLILSGGLIGLYAFRQWSSQAGPVRTAQALRRLSWIGAGLLVFLLIIRGGAALAWLPLLLPLLPRLLSNWRQHIATTASSHTNNTQSNVETQFLRMSLDHTSGEMRGTVLTGRFAGRALNELAPEELLRLWREVQSDAQSVAVLESYLDRTQEQDWREQARQQEHDSNSGAPLSREDAYEILGLQPGASPEEIKAAHRRLMQRVHPDHGGSTYLAARINQAKDLLLHE